MPNVYYNEHDPFAAAWLRELIKAGHIAPGEVDERSIEDVRPVELAGFTQCHFFGGIGVWSYALRQAGWPDDRPVWTGSCPCQPFSAAGKGKGFADERHLWPAWFHLIEQCRPDTIFGEQVASKDGLAWVDLVQTDLEGARYTSGALDLCAAGVGAPHIRQRLWFVAKSLGNASGKRLSQRVRIGRIQRETLGASERETAQCTSNACGMADTNSRQQSGQSIIRGAECDWQDAGRSQGSGEPESHSEFRGMADADCNGCSARSEASAATGYRDTIGATRSHDRHEQPSPTNGYWRDPDWLYCRDGKWRPVESGTFPLVDGAPARVGRLRGFGNAINAEAAAEFIKAAKEVISNA